MDIKKLEKLSCLKIEEENHEKIAQSISGVWDMITKLTQVNIPPTENVSKLSSDVPVSCAEPLIILSSPDEKLNDIPKVTEIKDRKTVEPMFNINEKTLGLKNEDGLFEATRVVHKKG